MAQIEPQLGYDRGVVFSPDGRLFQVDYAREAVRRGATALGITASEGVILMVDKKVSSRLVVPRSVDKVWNIDDHVGAVSSGLVADARLIVDHARILAQQNFMTYGETINIGTLTRKVSDYLQYHTQYGGVRPFGASLLIGGVDERGARVFETDPSGAMLEYRAVAIGSGRAEAMEVFEEFWTEDMSLEEGLIMGIDILKAQTKEALRAETIEIGVAFTETKIFEKMAPEQVRDLI